MSQEARDSSAIFINGTTCVLIVMLSERDLVAIALFIVYNFH
jgi:hypothetical protein